MRSWVMVVGLAAAVCGCGGESAGGAAGQTPSQSGSSAPAQGGGGGASAGTGGGGGAAHSTASGGGGQGGSGGAAGSSRADDLARDLAGRFDSSAQAAKHPAYYPIQLRMCRVDAPTIGPRVLYVEQAVMPKVDAPYRQRLYAIEPGDGADQARSRVFELVSPADFVGFCDAPAPRHVDAPAAEEKAGCRVDLTWDGDHFEGGTVGTSCPSSLNGATYATSEVWVDEAGVRSWDRGYDAHDQQVWGAVAGPYVFDRKTPIGQD